MRLDKVCGNLGYSTDNFEGKNFPEVVKAMLADVYKEMEAEGHTYPPEDFKYTNKKLTSMIQPLIRQKFW